MEAVLVKAGHPYVPTVSPCSGEQAQNPRAESACSGGLPHTSHARGSGGMAEAEEQRRRVATGSEGLKPSDNSHQVGLHLAMGISSNVCGMVAGINNDATHQVRDMDGGCIEVSVATRDDGGAKGVTICTGRDKQLHHVMRQSSRWRQVSTWAPPRARERRGGEVG